MPDFIAFTPLLSVQPVGMGLNPIKELDFFCLYVLVTIMFTFPVSCHSNKYIIYPFLVKYCLKIASYPEASKKSKCY